MAIQPPISYKNCGIYFYSSQFSTYSTLAQKYICVFI